MNLYAAALFLHVLGALGMFAALGIEWAVAEPLRRVADLAHARPSIAVLRSLHRLAGPSAVTILITGIYMGMTGAGRQPWMGLGLLGLVVLGALGGGVTGRRIGRIIRDLDSGSTSNAVLVRLQDPVLALSLRLRTAIGTGIIFLMTTKPAAGAAVAAMVVALVLGVVWSLPAFNRRRSPVAEQVV